MPNFVRVVSAQPGHITVLGDDGQTYTVTGSRNLRNNNPGNIEAGALANSLGAIGSDGRFAIFPNYQTGQAAESQMQFGSPRYNTLTIGQAITKWAPPTENDSAAYAARVARAVGVPVDTPMSSLTPTQQAAYLAAQQNIEGSQPQEITTADGVTLPPANIPGTDAPMPLPTPEGYYDVNASGGPDDRESVPGFNPPNVYSVPLAPLPSAVTSDYLSGDGGIGYGQPSLPLAAAAAQQEAAPMMTTANGNSYQVGKTYTTPDGYSYRANSDGSFSKVSNPARPVTPIQLYLESQTPAAQANLAKIGDAANTVKAAAQNALGFVGGLFSGPATGSLPPASLVASAPQPATYSNSADDLAFDPTILGFTADLNQPDRGYTGPTFDTPTFNDQGFVLPTAPNSSGSPNDRDSGSFALPMAQSSVQPSMPPASLVSTLGSGLNWPGAPTAAQLAPGVMKLDTDANRSGSPDDRYLGDAMSLQFPSNLPRAESLLPMANSSGSPDDRSLASSPGYVYQDTSSSVPSDGHGSDEDTSSMPILQSQSYTPQTGGYFDATSDHGADESDGADLQSVSSRYTIPASAVPKYIEVAQRVQVPGVDPAGDAESGTHWNDATAQFELGDEPATAPAPTFKTVYVQKPNPNYHPARTVTVSHPIMAAAAAPQPQTIAAPNGYNYVRNAQGGYTNAGQVNPNLTPAQVYSIAASAALNDGNPDGSAGMNTARPTYNSVGVANSLV